MSSTLVKTLNLTHEFAQASQQKDILYLKKLLSDEGEFEIQDDALETYDVNKAEFLVWYANKLEQTAITTISYDQCLDCQIGGSVVLFNDGKFPRKIKDPSERVKAGFKLEVVEDKIVNLKFCFVFLETENKYKFQCDMDRMKKYQEKGLTQSEILKAMQGDES
jgi:hypothetical protein